MKKLKFTALLLALTLSAVSFVGCSQTDASDKLDKEHNNQTSVDSPVKDNTEENNATELGFANVGERYNTVIKPVYDATLTILNDLIDCGLSFPDEHYNPKVTSIRYFNGSNDSLTITFRKDIYIDEGDIKAEFLQSEYSVCLENFNEHQADQLSEEYKTFCNFLITERKYEKTEKYEETVLPLAEQVADNFLRLYENYKENKQPVLHHREKQLILKSNSEFADLHKKIINKMNAQISEQKTEYFDSYGYPLLSDEDIIIELGGNTNDDPVYSKMTLTVEFQNFCYTFYEAPFNKNGEFAEDWINKFYGTIYTGYTPNPDSLYNPANEEYTEFFDKLKIEEMDFSTFTFHTHEYENTFLHF